MKDGWFEIPGVQTGKRRIADQMKGLAPLLEHIALAPAEHRMRVCDLGCAEGLILKACVDAGAHDVAGFEFVPQAVDEANRQLGRNRVMRHDLNQDFTWPIDADVVLMLAILHKLRDPLRLIDKVIAHAPELVVVRLPKETPGYVVDRRSGGVRHDIGERLAHGGYELDRVEKGHFDEWTGYFRGR